MQSNAPERYAQMIIPPAILLAVVSIPNGSVFYQSLGITFTIIGVALLIYAEYPAFEGAGVSLITGLLLLGVVLVCSPQEFKEEHLITAGPAVLVLFAASALCAVRGLRAQ